MSTDSSSVVWRARVHAALGEPARLAIVDALVLGDASPGEIGRQLSMPTNLVAHHLHVLADAGLVVRTRSEGDRRRSYLHLQPQVLAALISPGLRVPGRVVFVCTHNSARSQLAAALWRQRTGGPVASAGTRPAARVHPRAVATARRHGLQLDPAGTAHVDQVVHDDDLVIAVCDNAHEDLAAHEGLARHEGLAGHGGLAGARPARLHWSVPDPVRVDTDAAFEAVYTELAARIHRLAPAVPSA